jgi:predicted RNA-binding Zn-ribbon protein involved in translation (DUF1610 family)
LVLLTDRIGSGPATEARHSMAESSGIDYWIPGQLMSPEGPLARYGEPTPRGVAEEYVRAFTSPGDLILVPFCHSASLVREIQSTSRHVLALDFNPVGILSLRMALASLPRDELLAAFTRMGDAPKTDEPLRQYMRGLYATTCPQCGRRAVADAFVWDEKSGRPIERLYQCPNCGDRGRAPTEENYVQALERIGSHGLAYWYLADRVSSASSSHRATTERLLDLYTPRNLHAIAQIIIKMEDVLVDSPVAEAMKGSLLHCLDVGSALFRADAPEERPHRLRLPSRYLEHNVWGCLRHACHSMADHRTQNRMAPDLPSLMEAVGRESEALAYLKVGSLRAISGSIDSGSIALILLVPPRFDTVFWSLSYLWSGWLYGPGAAEKVAPLLGHRPGDWEWYRQSLQGAFRHAVELLRPGGNLLLLGQMAGEEQEAALQLAASGAGLTLDHAIGNGQGQVQLHFRRGPVKTSAPGGMTARPLLSEQLVPDTIEDLLRKRGEPTTFPLIRLTVLQILAKEQVLAQMAASSRPLSTMVQLWKTLEEDGRFARFDDGRWWLHDEQRIAPPLADRLEDAVRDILVGILAITPQALLRQVCERFAGPLTPEIPSETRASGLVEVCLRSYGEEFLPGYWRLAADEDTNRINDRVGQAGLVLEQLGRRLGYRSRFPTDAKEGGHYDIVWQDEGQIAHGFLLRWQARIATDVLTTCIASRAQQQYIALPQTRVALAKAKLDHDPRLARAIATGHWQFVKYSSLNALAAAKDVAGYDLRRIVGLEPIIERGEVQIPLF